MIQKQFFYLNLVLFFFKVRLFSKDSELKQ